MGAFDERIMEKFAEVELTVEQMHAYQNQAVEFLRENPFSALFIDMGLGKTVISLTVVQELLASFEHEKVLIIGPMRVATETWPTEIGRWEHIAWINHVVIHVDEAHEYVRTCKLKAKIKATREALEWELPSDQRQKYIAHAVQKAETRAAYDVREQLARSTASVHIVSRDWVEWLVNFFGPRWPYRVVIIDESSGFKDHASSRFKALQKVRNTPGLITRLHELTATPAAETYEHLWAQLYLMDRGTRLGKDITNYRRRYFTENRYTRKFELRPDAEEEILAKISDICLVMKAKDYLNLEEPLILPRKLKLDSREMGLYQEMATEMVVTLEDGTEIEAETAAALSSKLLQMASGVLYETYRIEDHETGDLKKVRRVHHIHDHKIEMLEQIVEEVQGATLLVAYHHQSSLARLKRAFPKAVHMDPAGKCVKAWNAGKIPMLFIHPQSGGHGLNLQLGGHNIVFFDLPWSLELYLQLIGRLARQGQKNLVKVLLLIAEGTIDEDVAAALVRKENAQDKFFSLLTKLIRRTRGTLKRGKSTPSGSPNYTLFPLPPTSTQQL